MVKPSFFSRAMVWPICWMMTGASPSVGSSSIRKVAPVRRMRAIASICCSPPESLVPWLLSRSFKFGKRSKICSSESPPPCFTTGGSIRFSRTSRLAKMPRSSGQKAMPIRAMRSEVARMISLLLKRIEPARLPMMPMIDLSVVVLPAPLRPSRVTTSPAFTPKLMPWRIWDSPYQASRFWTLRTSGASADLAGASAIFTSGMTGPQIGFLDPLILGQVGVIALRQHLPARQHGDDVGEIGDHTQIMLHHQDGVLRRDALDQGGNLVDVLVAHAGHWLVQQHHLRIERERRCNFQCALAPVGHLDRRCIGKLAEADIVQKLERAVIEAVQHRLGAPEIEGGAVLALQRHAHILQRGKVREHRRDLE